MPGRPVFHRSPERRPRREGHEGPDESSAEGHLFQLPADAVVMDGWWMVVDDRLVNNGG